MRRNKYFIYTWLLERRNAELKLQCDEQGAYRKKRKVLDQKTKNKGKHRERKEREKKKREKGRKTYDVSCDFQDGRLRVVTGTRHLTVSSSLLFSKSSEYSRFSLVPRAASLDRERYDCSSKNSRIGRECAISNAILSRFIFDARNFCTLFLRDTRRKNCTYGISFRRANKRKNVKT